MAQNVEHCVIRILNHDGATVGAGFVLAPDLAVTCAHVVLAAGSAPGGDLDIEFYAGTSQTVRVISKDLSPKTDDVAFLQLGSLPPDISLPVLGSAQGRTGHQFGALGFPKDANYSARWANGTLGGVVPARVQRQPVLQFDDRKVEKGMSGAPVLDMESDRIVGMISEYVDRGGVRYIAATTSETILSLCPPTATPTLRLWPDAYGIRELNSYLNYLCDTYGYLTLIDNSRVALERLYVSLRATEMNAQEWNAEERFYKEQVDHFTGHFSSRHTPRRDIYARRAALVKTIIRSPRPLKLAVPNSAHDRQSLFTERSPGNLSLAEVVQLHPCVVLLGDPGAGKTTLGKWLVLQYAYALLHGLVNVQVRADTVRPGDDAGHMVDLGPPRLPVYLPIAAYTSGRRLESISATTLQSFMGRQHQQKDLEAYGLTASIVVSLTQDYMALGRALVVLDGLDEVTDLDHRRAVMFAVKELASNQISRPPADAPWTGNRLLLTSRIIGYQFAPIANLPHYTVEDMDEDAITAFCRAWIAHKLPSDPNSVSEWTQKLKAAILDHTHPGVRVLAGNPLLLTILAQVYWNDPDHTLPSRRVELFRKAVHAFFLQRKETYWEPKDIDEDMLIRALSAVADHIHAQEVGGFVGEDTIKKILRTVLTAQQVAAMLVDAREVSGFLVARGQGIYGFLHRSLQEYFAAAHMAEDKDQVAETIAVRLFDPRWREPIAITAGLVSHHNDELNAQRLAQVFRAILYASDPLGDAIPRRELLAVSAFAECEHKRLPVEVEQAAHRTADNLLAVYTERDGRGRFPVLRERIVRAFTTLRGSVANPQAEAVLCEAVQSTDFDRRYAATDILIQAQWRSPGVASALVSAWRTHPGPAAAFLAALDDIAGKSSECFHDLSLPFRHFATTRPELWNRLASNPCWQAVLRLLYLPSCASFTPDAIYRDSPWTDQVIEVLSTQDVQSAFVALKSSFIHISHKQGTALARDAALAEAALGHREWVPKAVNNAQEDGIVSIMPVLATLALNIDQNVDLALDLSLDIESDLALADARGQDIPEFARAGDLDLPHALAYDLACDIALARDLARTRTAVRLRYISEPANAHHFTLGPYRDLTRPLARNLARARAQALDLNPDICRDIVRDTALVFNRNLARDIVRSGNPDIGDDIPREPSIDEPSVDLEEIETLIRQARARWEAYPNLVGVLSSALDHVGKLRGVFCDLKPMTEVFTELMQSCDHEQLTIRTTSSAYVRPQSEVNDILDESVLQSLPKQLTSGNDGVRRQARDLLLVIRSATALTQSVIESMTALAHKHENEPQIGTQLKWALNSIEHDKPTWLHTWVAMANATETITPALTILRSINRASAYTVDALLEVLPSAAPHVRIALLHSLGWLARLNRLAYLQSAKLDQIGGLLRAMLNTEENREVRPAIIEILGHWTAVADRDTSIDALLTALQQDCPPAERAAIYTALARLASITTPRIEQVRGLLIATYASDGAPAALARLMFMQAWKQADPAFPYNEGNLQQLQTQFNEMLPDIDAPPLHGSAYLTALLEAGTDDDLWHDGYHGMLVRAIAATLLDHTELLPYLLGHLRTTMQERDWTASRIALGAVACCAETLPQTLKAVALEANVPLQDLLVRGATDPGSYISRCFAFHALSYLADATPDVVSALLVGYVDIEAVQKEAIAAAERFQSIEGDPLPLLIPVITGESLSAAYAAVRLLGTLGTSEAGIAAGLPDRILAALVGALKHWNNSEEVIIGDERKGKLEDTLYEVLVQVVGQLD